MLFKTTATIEFKNGDAATVGEHALKQHVEKTRWGSKGWRVIVEETIDSSTIEGAVTNMRYSVGVILTQEAGFEVNAFKLVAASAEVV